LVSFQLLWFHSASRIVGAWFVVVNVVVAVVVFVVVEGVIVTAVVVDKVVDLFSAVAVDVVVLLDVVENDVVQWAGLVPE
jgi:hypothetical protein